MLSIYECNSDKAFRSLGFSHDIHPHGFARGPGIGVNRFQSFFAYMRFPNIWKLQEYNLITNVTTNIEIQGVDAKIMPA